VAELGTMTTIQMKKLIKSALFFVSFVIIVSLAFGSKGGDDKGRKGNTKMKSDFVPIRISSSFLKNGFTYSGSHIFSIQKEKTAFSFNTLVTYQRGNTTFIIPYKYKVNTGALSLSPAKSNLQMVGLKISMHK
jgi:hypothetical protein